MKKLLEFRKNLPIRCYDSSECVYVQSHLAVSPTEMNQMRERGIPIASQVDSTQFYDGDTSPSVSIDPMFRRGVDINDAWNLQEASKRKLNSAYVNDVKTYGR